MVTNVFDFEPQEDSRMDISPELTLAGWPLPDTFVHQHDSPTDKGKWDINPLALYNKSGKEKCIVLLQHYDLKP